MRNEWVYFSNFCWAIRLFWLTSFIVYHRVKNKKVSKTLYIIATVYLIISFGVCGSIMI